MLEIETKNRTIKFYEDTDYKASIKHCLEPPKSAKKKSYLPFKKKVLAEIASWFPKKASVLEVCAGNGYTSELLRRQLVADAQLLKYRATELFSGEQKFTESLERGLASEAAVKKYASDFNVLVMIAPPHNSYADYYAIKEFELVESKSPKHLLYVGEIGQCDGCEGMDKYLFGGSGWKLLHQATVFKFVDILGAASSRNAHFFSFKND